MSSARGAAGGPEAGAALSESAPPFSLVYGASWLLPSGEVLLVPGFHEEWLAAHPGLARGARNVCELILRERWISVALFGGGYLELMVPDRRSPEVRRMIWELLSRNAGSWSKVLVMSMDEEGYALLGSDDASDEAGLSERLSRPL
jgi:hypothetical protein